MRFDAKRACDRNAILEALWADPIAASLNHALPARLKRGDEYLDLQRLEAGVQHAQYAMAPTGGELARMAIAPVTWEKILAHLAAGGAPRR